MAINRANPATCGPSFPWWACLRFAWACMTCGGDGGPRETGAINISPNTISFTTAPGGALDPKTVGITPATVDLTGLTATAAYTGTPPSPWLEATLGSVDGDAREPGDPDAQGDQQQSAGGHLPGHGHGPEPRRREFAEGQRHPRHRGRRGAGDGHSALGDRGERSGAGRGAGGAASDGGWRPGGAGGRRGLAWRWKAAGSLAGPATSTTDAQGQATFDGLSVTALIGEHTLLFTAQSLTEVRSNPIAITVGAASHDRGQLGDPAIGRGGYARPTIRRSALVTDAAGNPVEGVPVTFAVTQGGGTIDPTTPVPTGADGLASLHVLDDGARCRRQCRRPRAPTG